MSDVLMCVDVFVCVCMVWVDGIIKSVFFLFFNLVNYCYVNVSPNIYMYLNSS